jgi:hypothetical protein
MAGFHNVVDQGTDFDDVAGLDLGRKAKAGLPDG